MATPRIKVDPEVIRWAVRYSRREDVIRKKFGEKLAGWESGELQPTYLQLRDFANEARLPEWYLICGRIPDYDLGEMEMRTLRGSKPEYPSPDLVDTLEACRDRQSWYIGYAAGHCLDPVEFVASMTVDDAPEDAARIMAETIGFTPAERERTSREDYRLALTKRIEDARVLVMINSMVGNDSSRPLNEDEFRGFSLIDPLAPLIFVNAADALGAQVFSLAHEFAHVLLGRSGVSAPDSARQPTDRVEVWCNAVAAEFLVPSDELAALIGDSGGDPDVDALSRHFKVSRPVILRRLRDTGRLDPKSFRRTYASAIARSRTEWKKQNSDKSAAATNGEPGGDFSNILLDRVGRRFASALYTATEGGRTFYGDAADLLEVRDSEYVDKLGEELGLAR